MAQRKYKLHNGKKGAALAIRVTTRAARDQIIGALNDGTVKVHITAAPPQSSVNEHLVEFLSGILSVSKERIEVVAGDTGRDKLVSVLDMDSETLHKKIVENME